MYELEKEPKIHKYVLNSKFVRLIHHHPPPQTNQCFSIEKT